MSLFSCPVCGESVEIPDAEPEEGAPPLTCPVCGSFVQEEEPVVAITVTDERPRRVRQ